MYALVDHYRPTTGLPWLPGGVAVLGPSDVLQSRYSPDEGAVGAMTRFRSEVAMIQDAIDRGVDPLEAMSRAARSGFSGHLSWQVIIEVPEGTSLQALYAHYVEAGKQAEFPGAREVEPLELPFG